MNIGKLEPMNIEELYKPKKRAFASSDGDKCCILYVIPIRFGKRNNAKEDGGL